jgi:hypothetical protein
MRATILVTALWRTVHSRLSSRPSAPNAIVEATPAIAPTCAQNAERPSGVVTTTGTIARASCVSTAICHLPTFSGSSSHHRTSVFGGGTIDTVSLVSLPRLKVGASIVTVAWHSWAYSGTDRPTINSTDLATDVDDSEVAASSSRQVALLTLLGSARSSLSRSRSARASSIACCLAC